MGVPNVACQFLEMTMSHVSVAYFPQCHMSNLRNGHVPCHYILTPHVTCHYAPCHMSTLRNDHVNLSILGVKGHNKLSQLFTKSVCYISSLVYL